MSYIFLHLRKVHDSVHDLSMKLQYNEPKLFTGGVDITNWYKLSKADQKRALSKDWYVYYSFRNPKTNKLVRQTNLKGGTNVFKDKLRRCTALNILKKGLMTLLDEGYNPYKDNLTFLEYLEKREKEKVKIKSKNKTKKKKKVLLEVPMVIESTDDAIKVVTISIEDAFILGLETKANILATGSYTRFKSRINRFKVWLEKEGFDFKCDINTLNKKTVIQYLNTVLQNTSPRNRNNARTDIGSLFQVLVDNDVILDNFVRKINVLKAIPKRNKTYTPTQLKEVLNYVKTNDPVLHLFVQFFSYNFLRPIEVCRLRIGDLDLEDKKLYVRAKNQLVKTKIIPDILIKELPDLTKFRKDDFLFTPDAIGGTWETLEENKRNFFTKRFKKVKDHFDLGIEYGLYSFRHTLITKLYKEMAKNATPFEVKSKLLLITGHATMSALELYLRDIDAVLPEDYSNLLE
ncbi:tyrosine-type recombinase/integrase [Lacinutrix jangbogonensis]|uniref:tyrosine-type recombinase/integrase n=1 Tax=Lacinutrix jangbogonensis TaxID=1469557 RepID=UPI00053E9155|nr:site-specific integrase [Lacinutrix jangbogonensis]